ncbi:trehalose-phosphatase [Lysobacter sp. A3-1-A15]|uniref:trehalose-phosphatase n=1 Tax=Novilysobacter viscosus TaxID=3098602 RepID=UPI0039838321
MRPTDLPPPPAWSDHWALFLDVDGTLLDVADAPHQVHVDPAMLDALDTLHGRLGGALALVSGRSLEQIDHLFSPLRLPAAGLHGLEHRDDAPFARPPTPLRTLRGEARSVALRHPGAVVEDKGATIALHWRGNPQAEPALRSLVEAAMAWLPGYRLQEGDHVLEVRPQGDNKGAAVGRMLDQPPFAGRTPVFVGNDHTDEDGFDAVLAHGGIAVLVGDRQPSRAAHRLASPADVRAWLARNARA